MKKIIISLLTVLLVCAWATDKTNSGNSQHRFLRTNVSLGPSTDEKTHHAGDLYMTVSNYGFFGSQRGNSDPDCILDAQEVCGNSGVCAPSGEYPGCSGLEYLFMGALWIGAVINGDTLVSVGEDGWERDANELFPTDAADDTLVYRSILNGDSTAISEEDYLGKFSDITVSGFSPPDHKPIGVQVEQKSYAWSYNYSANFVFINYKFKNIRDDDRTISDMYIGLYIDGDVGHVDVSDYAQDDITGFIQKYFNSATGETVEVNLAWIADNDGDPTDQVYTAQSPVGAMAARVLQVPEDVDRYSYNWWISNSTESYDWGPARTGSNPGFDGTPSGDINKYKVLSNGEFDFDQTATTDSATSANWQGAPLTDNATMKDIANGYDTRYLLSFGPMNIAPHDSVEFTIGFIVGNNFHVNPRNANPNTNPAWSASEFNFTELTYAAYWVKQIYDNDYKGPQPPPTPNFSIVTGENKVTILWKPDTLVENFFDNITGLYDFEGYRIYVSEAKIENYFVPIAQFDKVDYYTIDYVRRTTDTLGMHTYADMPSDTVVYSDSLYRVPVVDGVDTVDWVQRRPTRISSNNGMPPETTIAGETYYYYEIENLLPGDDKFIVITSFDYGQPSKMLDPIESNKVNFAKWVVPAGKSSKDNIVRVVPNPYRVDHDYSEHWEKSYTGEWSEYSRKLRFYNIPTKCKIRIYTLDGDLVQTLDHDETASASAGSEMVGAEDWNLITRNDQAVTSGIYVLSVEDADGEIQTGKFVIIK